MVSKKSLGFMTSTTKWMHLGKENHYVIGQWVTWLKWRTLGQKGHNLADSSFFKLEIMSRWLLNMVHTNIIYHQPSTTHVSVLECRYHSIFHPKARPVSAILYWGVTFWAIEILSRMNVAVLIIKLLYFFGVCWGMVPGQLAPKNTAFKTI